MGIHLTSASRIGTLGMALSLGACAAADSDAPAPVGSGSQVTTPNGGGPLGGAETPDVPPGMGGPMPSGPPPTVPGISLPTPAGIEGRESLATRLTNLQYQSTILDVLGVQLTQEQLSAAGLPADATHEDHFVTYAAGQNFSSAHVRAYSQLARSVVAQMDAAAVATEWAGCADVSSACNTAVTLALGGRLFRRPLTSDEQQRMQQLFTDVATFAGATFADVAGAMFRAYLQAPQFLYRLEVENVGPPGTTRGVSGHELAARLSYFLWQSAPDAALRTFADGVAAGGLDEAALSAQVDSMLKDPRFARSRETFWADYTLASQASYAEAGERAEDLRRTILASVDRVTGGGATEAKLNDLFTMKELVLSEELATTMGLVSKGPGDQVYDVSSAPQRLGLFTHPGFIAGMGTTSFVGRGKYMSERLLCHVIASPNLDNPEFKKQLDDTAEATSSFTPRQAMEYRFGLMGACTVCHKAFEPIAFAFEQFDIKGDFTEKDEQGRALLSSGYLQDRAGQNVGDVANVPELMQLLASREETAKCFVENQLSFAAGLAPKGSDGPALELAFAEFQAGGSTYSALARAIARNPQLQAIKVVAPE